MPIVRRTATNLIGALARAGAAVYSWHCDAARRLRLVVASRAACKAMPGGAGAGCTKAAGARECPESEASHAAAAADRIVGPLRHLTQKHYERRRGGATPAADEPSPGFQQAFGSYRQTQTNPDKPRQTDRSWRLAPVRHMVDPCRSGVARTRRSSRSRWR